MTIINFTDKLRTACETVMHAMIKYMYIVFACNTFTKPAVIVPQKYQHPMVEIGIVPTTRKPLATDHT